MPALPTPKVDIHDISARLWETADELRANSHLKAAEYSVPVLGLIFLKFADSRFTQMEAGLAGKGTGRREIGKADLPSQRRPVPSQAVPIREPPPFEGRRQPRQSHQRRDGRYRRGEPSS